MAQVAGELEIRMFAELARLRRDMEKANSVVAKSTRGIERAAGSAVRALGALGIGIGVLGFARMVKGALDAQDELVKLSQKVGVSVEGLVGLKHAADLSGVSFEGLQKGIKTVATQMFDASMGLLESQRNFKALGIEIKGTDGRLKGAEAVLVEVADRFAKMRDGTEKAALAVKLFGKAGLDMIPMLNQGSAALAQMVAEGKALNPTTAESARQAEIFNDNMTRLTGAVKGFGISMLNDVLPTITKVSEAMVAAQRAGEGFWGTMNRGLQQFLTGDDMHKWNVEMSNAAGGLITAMNKLDEANRRLRETPGSTFWSIEAKTAKEAIDRIQAEIKRLQAIKPILAPDVPTAAPGARTGGAATVDDAALKAAAKAQLQQDEQFAQKFADRQAVENEYMSQNIDFTSDWQEKRLEVIMAAGERERKMRQDAAQYEMDQIDAQNKLKKAKQDQELQDRMQFLGNLAGLMNTNSKSMFELGKKAALAQAAYKGSLAVMDAWEAGMSVGGPWAPLVAAAYAAAAGINAVNLINNIKSQEFGGGGAAGSVPISATQGASGIAPQSAANDSGRGQTTIINMPPGAFISRKAVRELLEMQNENSVDGSRIIVNDR